MGNQDVPLNDVGKSQADMVYRHLQNEPIQHIVTSPLQRALETTHIVNKRFNLPITVVDELREVSFGKAEGTPYDDGTLIQQWVQGDNPKGAETFIDFESRVMTGIQKALKLDEHVLVISHGVVYSCLSRRMSWTHIDLQPCEPIFHRPPMHSTHPWFVYSLFEEA